MRRRTFVTLALAGLVGGAGCLDRAQGPAEGAPKSVSDSRPVSGLVPDLPVTEKTDIVKRGVESAPVTIADLDAFRTALEERDVVVERLESNDGYLALDHPFDDGGLADPLGVVAGCYAAYVGGADDRRTLSATTFFEGEPVGEYAVLAAWVDEYERGVLTTKEYGEKVLGTVTTA
ncbi:hypothetical protein [Halomarina ordinaria]|uniref:DUF8159 domain-containing protein n=1 Tax=Halomarina ordinaria TaxID=3033939 RepID=A0ABD5UAN5_9EURY|nr:hypothetical protein [Halomarina sp. PSRA2]